MTGPVLIRVSCEASAFSAWRSGYDAWEVDFRSARSPGKGR